MIVVTNVYNFLVPSSYEANKELSIIKCFNLNFCSGFMLWQMQLCMLDSHKTVLYQADLSVQSQEN